MWKFSLPLLIIILLTTGVVWFATNGSQSIDLPDKDSSIEQEAVNINNVDEKGEFLNDQHPLSIEYMRDQDYSGSELVIEQTLTPGSNYQRYVASYKSEGLKQYAMLTVPNGKPPTNGWPGIVFNHGYISPSVYRTTERYVAYVDGFAKSGYVVLKPDYRGHGNSEGQAEGGYGSPAYTIDVLNAFASLQKYPDVNPNRIGMWGHSMGGHLTLRSMVTNPEIKAGVIWGGVVGSYQDYQNYWWSKRRTIIPITTPRPGDRGYWRYSLYQQYGTFDENPEFWDSISTTTFLKDVSGPIQLHHAKGDESVPYILSEKLNEKIQNLGLESELFLYEGDDHNISDNFGTAMRESVEWFDQYLKNS